MNVMILVHGLGVGGAEVMVCHLARHLRDRGSLVEIACLGELGELGEVLRSQGFAVVLHQRRPGFDRTLALRLARRCRQGRFDVVHAHQRTGLFYGLLAGMLHSAPLVYSEHGPLFGGPPSRKKSAFNRLFNHRTRRITAVCEAVRMGLESEEGFAGRAIEIVPNGVDLRRFGILPRPSLETARQRCGLPPTGTIIGTVGRLSPVKNHGLLLHVAKRLRGRVGDFSLVIVGDGPERPATEALADRLGLTGKVLFLGQRDDVELLLPAFDVFCLSSLSEGIPLTLLEAMAARVPVVATSVDGIAEAARSGEDAVLIDGKPPDCRNPLTASGDGYVEKFARGVERLLLDQRRFENLTRNAYQRVAGTFSMDVVCERYEAILQEAVSGCGERT